MPHVCVIGAGFGGLTAVRALRKRHRDLKITLVSPKREFVYYPSLIWIPTGLRQGRDITVSLDAFIDKQRVDFHQARVTAVTDGGRTVRTDKGDIANDGLIIASGGRYLRRLPGIDHAVIPCAGIAEAEEIRDRLVAMVDRGCGAVAMGFGGNPKEPSGVRGGPVFEFLLGIDSYLRKIGKRQAIDLAFFSPAPKPGIRMGEKSVTRLMAEIKRRDISVRVGQKLIGFKESRIETEGGALDAELIVFMPGLTGPSWLTESDLPLSPGGMIRADRLCRIDGLERSYVVGDSGSFPGPEWLPKQAHMADLQARAAAENLLADLAGGKAKRTFRVELICIVDSLNGGTVIYRDRNRSLRLPMSAPGHWLKRAFEAYYLSRMG